MKAEQIASQQQNVRKRCESRKKQVQVRDDALHRIDESAKVQQAKLDFNLFVILRVKMQLFLLE